MLHRVNMFFLTAKHCITCGWLVNAAPCERVQKVSLPSVRARVRHILVKLVDAREGSAVVLYNLPRKHPIGNACGAGTWLQQKPNLRRAQ